MKKNFFRALVVLLCITLLAGCTPSPSEAGTPAHADATSDIANSTFHFDSYEDMISAFGKRDLNPSAYTIRELKKLLGEPYTRFVDRVNADRGFPQPMLDGEPIPYRNQEGFSNITFCVNELYGFPWVFYYPTVSTGENFYIHATYLPDEGMKDKTASEVIREISPNAPNIGNMGDRHENIYNRPLNLRDREVTALVIEYKDDTRDSIFFVYENLLVSVCCNPDVWNELWFSALSFGMPD